MKTNELIRNRRVWPITGAQWWGVAVVAMLLAGPAWAGAIFTNAGTTSWTCPNDGSVSIVEAQCWGGGGAGGSAWGIGTAIGGGGAGGAFARKYITVSGGTSYTVVVGTSGVAAASGSLVDGTVSGSGGDSYFISTSAVLAKGGVGGVGRKGNANGAGGAGSTSGCIGDTLWSGGDGGTAGVPSNHGGGGGGGAGSVGGGGAGKASGGTIAPGGVGGGGNGGASRSNAGAGAGGMNPGGGGAGAYAGNGNKVNGGNGGTGQVYIAYCYFSKTGQTDPTSTTSWSCTRDGTGNSPANFTGGDVFIIQNGHSMTAASAWTISGAASARLEIENGGTLTSTALITTPTFQVDDGGTYYHNYLPGAGICAVTDFPGSTNTYLSASSTVEIQKWGNGAISALPSLTWGNLTINVATLSATWDQAGGIRGIQGTLWIKALPSATNFVLTSTTTTNLTIGGNLILQQTTSGKLQLSSGTGVMTLNVLGSVTNTASGGGGVYASTAGNGIINFAKSGTQQYASGGSVSNVNWNINSGSTVDFGTSVLIGSNGTFTLSNGGGLITANTGGIAASGASGCIQVTGTRTYGVGNYTYNGSSAQVTGNGLPTAANGIANLTINNSAGVTLSGNASVTGTLTLTSGQLAVGANTLELTGPAIAGTPANLQTTSSSSLSFGGNAASVALPSSVTALNNLSINNANGVTLNSSPTVNGTLTLTSGLLNAGANTLTVASAGSILGGSSSAYVAGKLAQGLPGTGSKTFPIGKSGNYRPLTINMTALTGASTVTAEQIEPGNTFAGSFAGVTVFPDRYWTVTESGSSARTYDITLDGTGFSPSQTPVILKYANPTTTKLSTTTPNYTAQGLTSFSDFALGDAAAGSPTITVTGGPTLSFGNVEQNTVSATQTITVAGSYLTGDITNTPPAGYEISTNTAQGFGAAPIALVQSAGTVPTTTIYVRFTPTALQSYNGSLLSISSPGAATENVTLNGTGVGSAQSDITADGGFSYPTNIAHASHQETDLTASSLAVAQFILRDGGGATDADNAGTTLTNLAFSVANSGNLRRVALYDGNTELGEVAAGATVTFSGLTVTAADGGAKTLTLRASFQSAVTDNQQISFTVTSAQANGTGSRFAAGNAGGAVSSTAGDNNRIEVTATRLVFTSVPTSVTTNTDFTVTVHAEDTNNNVDLDDTTSVTLSRASGSGTLSSVVGLTQNLVNGVKTWTDVQMDTIGIFTIQAAGGTLTSGTSGSIGASVKSWADTGNNWTASGSWTPAGAPGVGDPAYFSAASYSYQPNMDGVGSIGRFQAAGGSGAITFGAGTATLTLNGLSGVGLQADSGAGGINFSAVPLALGAAQSWVNDSANAIQGTGGVANAGYTLTLQGSGAGGFTLGGAGISGNGGLTVNMSGGGVVNLTGTNTFAGGATISGGTLQLGDGTSGKDGTVVGDITNNAALVFNYAGSRTNSGAISGSGSVSKSGSGTLTLSGNSSYNGGTMLSAGRLNVNHNNALGNGAVSLAAGTMLDNTSGGPVTITNAVTMNGNLAYAGTTNLTQQIGVVTLSAPAVLSVTNTLAINGAISGGANSLTKAGSGTLVLGNNNAFSGGMTVSAGTLVINHNNALGSGTLTISGGTLDNQSGGLVTIDNAVAWNGNFTFTGTTNLTQQTGAVTLNGNRKVTVSANTLTLNGVVSGAGCGLAKGGAGTLVLGNANNTYDGTLAVSNGTVVVVSLADSGTGCNGTGAIGMGEANSTVATLTYMGSGVTLSRQISWVSSGLNVANKLVFNNDGSGPLVFTANPFYTGGGSGGSSQRPSITLGGANTGTVAGAIADCSLAGGTLSVIKQGTGAWTLSGNNTYSDGTTLNAGTLNLGHSNALGTGTLQINAGTTLDNTSGGPLTITNAITLNGSFTFTGTQPLTQQTGAISMINTPPTLTIGTGGTLTLNGVISGNWNLTKAGVGTLALGGANTFPASLSINNGTLALTTINNNNVNGPLGNSANAVNLGSSGLSATLQFTGTGTSDKGFTLVTGGTGTFEVVSGTLTLGGVLTSGGTVNKTGAGTLVVTNTASTYSGALSVKAGTLSVPVVNDNNANGPLGKNTGSVTLGASGATATLEYTGNTASSTKKFTLATGGTGVFQIDTAGQTLTLNGLIDGAGNLTKTGAGILGITNATYSGDTALSAGTLKLSGSGASANTPKITMAGGATLDVSGLTAQMTLGAGQTLETTNTSTTTTTLATDTGKGLTLNAASPVVFRTFKPAEVGGVVPLTLSGAGTLTLGANSPVTITVANGGTPLAGGDYKLIAKGASGTVATVPGGTLTVNGDCSNSGVSLAISSGELYLHVVPVITAAAATAGPVTTTYGTASAATTFTVSGVNMTEGILVTPPAGYEVSTDNSTFADTVTVGSAGTIANTTVYVRLKATSAVGGAYDNQNIVLTSAGATTVNVSTGSGNAVEKKALSITAPTVTKVYDGGTSAGTVTPGTLSGFVGSETVTATGVATAYASKNVGAAYSVTVSYTLHDGSNGGVAANYSLANSVIGNAGITPKALSIAGTTVTKEFDGTTAPGAVTPGTLSGFVGTETVTATGLAASYPSSAVGSYPNITVTYTLHDGNNGGLGANYNLANDSVTATITMSPGTVYTFR